MNPRTFRTAAAIVGASASLAVAHPLDADPIAAPVATAPPAAPTVPAAAPGIAFDELTIVFDPSDASHAFKAPGPGSYRALLGAAMLPSPGARNSAATHVEGTLFRYSFLGRLARFDNETEGGAMIYRPDRDQISALNFAAKTYVTLSGAAAAPYFEARDRKQAAPAATPAPGTTTVISIETPPPANTVKLAFFATDRALPNLAIDGVTARGTEHVVTATPVRVVGSCPLTGSWTMKTVTYYDPARDNPNAAIDTAAAGPAPGAHSDTFSCDQPKQIFDHATAWFDFFTAAYTREVPGGGFLLYARTDENCTYPGRSMPVSIATVTAHGNFRTLGAPDASLFDVPPGLVPQGSPGGTPEPSPR